MRVRGTLERCFAEARAEMDQQHQQFMAELAAVAERVGFGRKSRKPAGDASSR
jgi:hypothetical protein